MNNRTRIIIAIVISLVAVAIIIISSLLFSQTPTPPKLQPTPIAVPTIKTTDIYKQPDNSYQIFSYPDRDEYWILIMASPFSKYRSLAETQFLKQTGLSKDKACKLNIKVTTPYYVNPNESGTNYPLSFCPPRAL
jgi:hypothetical protein